MKKIEKISDVFYCWDYCYCDFETADFLEGIELSFQMVKFRYYLIKTSSPLINFKNYLKFKPTFRNYPLRSINMERHL